MTNMSIKTKLIISFSVLFFFLVVLGGCAYYAIDKTYSKNSEITASGIQGSALLHDIIDEANRSRRSVMFRLLRQGAEGKAESDKIIAMSDDLMNKKINAYRSFVQDTVYENKEIGTKNLTAINEFEKVWKQYSDLNKEIIKLDSMNNPIEVIKVFTGPSNVAYADLFKIIVDNMELNSKYTASLIADGEMIHKNVIITIIVILLVSLIVNIGIGYAIIRSIRSSIFELNKVAGAVSKGDLTIKADIKTRDELGKIGEEYNRMITNINKLINKIQHSACQVAASSEELTASADQSAGVTQQIAKSITDVSVASDSQVRSVEAATKFIEQISAGIEESATTVVIATEKTKQAVLTASQGNDTIHQTVKQMGFIEETVGKSAEVVTKLGERSKEIGQIVDTISGIAGQTNLLALNAAIEAARAGEQGKGFAVVAEEVRKLAEQSQGAAKQIGDLIHAIQSDTDAAVIAMNSGTEEVKQGAELANKAGKDFESILGMVKEVNVGAVEISTIMEELAKRSEEVVGAVQEIDHSTQAVASEAQSVSAATEEQSAAMQEIAAGSRSLANLAQEMQAAANQFKV